MASWLKVAEDLLEVVDRRAKLVVGEIADEQPNSQATTASNVEEVNARRRRSKDKANLKLSNSEKPKGSKVEQAERRKELAVPNATADKTSIQIEKTPDIGISETNLVAKESSSGNHEDGTKLDAEDGKAEIDAANLLESKLVDSSRTISNPPADEEAPTDSKYQAEPPSHPPVDKEIEVASSTHSADAVASASIADEGASLNAAQDKSDSKTVKSHSTGEALENKKDVLPEPSSVMEEKQHVQDQLDEAQGLLQTAVKTGQSKEARMARVCAGLSSRLQEYKAENKQLEELLVAERELSSSYEARIQQLQQELSSAKSDVSRVESSMSDALAAKNSEIESLVSSLDLLKKQSATSEEKLTSLQSDMENISRSRELTETRMIQALREELASAERRAEEERAAHSATKKAAVEREIELEHRAVEASNALARIQRSAEESTSRAAELEHKVNVLEVECASLNQELQELEARSRRSQKKSQEEANQILQAQAWQEEVERARQGQRDAENKLSTLEAEIQKLRVEMAGMKRDAEHYSRQEHMELEKRYRELTDLLYHKQTQLETMASEKAALEFQLDKEIRRLQEAQLEAERSRTVRRSSSSWEEDTDMKALEPLPLHHRHMAGANIQLQKAAKLLDTGAVRATRFLWRYPTARVVLLFYLVFVHLFLMYLLHRLQEQADSFSNKEVAASMGLGNSSLP